MKVYTKYFVYNLICILLLCLSSKSMGGDAAHFDQFSINEGLSQSSVNCIYQDKLGFIWLGTQDGLNRYNGKINKIIYHTPFDSLSLLGNNILQIAYADKIHIYVLSTKGIDKINIYNFKITHVSTNKNESEFNLIYSFFNVNTNLFINTDKGLFKYNMQNKWTKIPCYLFGKELIIKINDVIEVKKNTYVLASNLGIGVCSDSLTNKININKLSNINTPKFVIYNNNILCYSDHNLYSISNHDFMNSKLLYKFKSSINSILNFKNKLWIGTENNGIFVLDINSNDSIRLYKNFTNENNRLNGLKSNIINCLYVDSSINKTNLWIGTRDAGAFCYNENKNIFKLISDEINIPEKTFFALSENSNGLIWASSNNYSYVINRRDTNYFTISNHSIHSQFNFPIEAVISDVHGNFWIGYKNSLYMFNVKTYNVQCVIPQISPVLNNKVFRLLWKDDKNLMIGMLNNLSIYNIENKNLTQISEIVVDNKKVNVGPVTAIYIDAHKRWWLGGTNGVICYNSYSQKGSLFHYNLKNKFGLLSNIINDITALKNGKIVVCSSSGISILVDENKKIFKNYGKSNDFKNSFVYCALSDKNDNLWLSTNYGIYKFNPESDSFICYNSISGSYFNEFNSGGFCKNNKGELFFAGMGGILSIDPNIVKPIVSNIPLYVTLKSNDNIHKFYNLNVNENVKFNYKNNSLNLYFESPVYFEESNVSLSFNLVGDDTSSYTVFNDFNLRFLNLNPGNYKLNVFGNDNLNRYIINPLSLTILIEPPFWNTNAFYFLIFVFISTCIVLLYRYNLNKKVKIIKLTEEIAAKENEKVRKAAAMDLHDEFGNGLTRISMLIELLKDKLVNPDEEVNKLVNLISENSKRLYLGTKDFIWSINPSNDSLYECMLRIKDFIDENISYKNIDFLMNGLSEDIKNIKIEPSRNRNISLIFKEAVSNTLKHANASKITFNIVPSQHYYTLMLKDNGNGFDINSNSKGFGLNNIITRAGKINSELIINSSPGTGTEIILKFKILNK